MNDNTLNDVQEQVVAADTVSENDNSEVNVDIDQNNENIDNTNEEVTKPRQSREDNAIAKAARLQAKADADKEITLLKQQQDDFAKNHGYNSWEELKQAEEDKKLEEEAELKGTTIETLKEQMELNEKLRLLQEENKFYKDKEMARIVDAELKKIQTVDPNIKDLTELGDDYFDLVKFYVNKGKEPDSIAIYNLLMASKPKPKPVPPDIGDFNNNKSFQEKDYYTSEEVDRLTSKQLDDPKIMNIVMKSMTKWR